MSDAEMRSSAAGRGTGGRAHNSHHDAGPLRQQGDPDLDSAGPRGEPDRGGRVDDGAERRLDDDGAERQPNGAGERRGTDGADSHDPAGAVARSPAPGAGEKRWAAGPDPAGPEPGDQLDRRLWRRRQDLLEAEARLNEVRTRMREAQREWDEREQRKLDERNRQVGAQVASVAQGAGIDPARLAQLLADPAALAQLQQLLGGSSHRRDLGAA